jgi:hypothetical protein
MFLSFAFQQAQSASPELGSILWGVSLVISAASPVILAMMKRSQDRHNAKQDRIAEAQRLATVEVKDTLLATGTATDKKLSEQGKTLGDVHTLVNSQKGVMLNALAIALKANAILAREKADRADANELDKVAAQLAQRAADKAQDDLRIHEEQQAIVDARKKSIE